MDPIDIINKLDDTKDNEISVEELKKNLDKLNTDDLAELANFLKNKDSAIINAFTDDTTGKNALEELAIAQYSELKEEMDTPTEAGNNLLSLIGDAGLWKHIQIKAELYYYENHEDGGLSNSILNITLSEINHIKGYIYEKDKKGSILKTETSMDFLRMDILTLDGIILGCGDFLKEPSLSDKEKETFQDIIDTLTKRNKILEANIERSKPISFDSFAQNIQLPVPVGFTFPQGASIQHTPDKNLYTISYGEKTIAVSYDDHNNYSLNGNFGPNRNLFENNGGDAPLIPSLLEFYQALGYDKKEIVVESLSALNNLPLQEALGRTSDTKKQEALKVLANYKLQEVLVLLSDPKSQEALRSLNSLPLNNALILLESKKNDLLELTNKGDNITLNILNNPSLKEILDNLISCLSYITKRPREIINNVELKKALDVILDSKFQEPFFIANGKVRLNVSSTIDYYLEIMAGNITIKGYDPKPQNVEELVITNSNIRQLPQSIGVFNNLTKLDLSINKLTTLPAEIGDLKNLTKLDLSMNKLTTLPAEIGDLKSLTMLYLSDNNLTEIPPEIGSLEKLTELSLYNNNLTKLPPEVGRLENLTTLKLGNNNLTEIPPEVGRLENLTTLKLGNNNLTEIPPEVGDLKSLTELGLSMNKLTTLPAEIGKLTNLQTLYLSNNQLTTLPNEVYAMKKLTNIDVRENPKIFVLNKLKNGKEITKDAQAEERIKQEEEKFSRVSDERVEGEYLEAVYGERNPAGDLIGQMEGLTDFSFDDDIGIGNEAPGQAETKSPLLMTIDPSLPENYRGAVYDITLTSKKSFAKNYTPLVLSDADKSVTGQVYAMTLGPLTTTKEAQQLILPLGAKVIDAGGYPLDYDSQTGLYRIDCTKLTDNVGPIKFVINQTTSEQIPSSEDLTPYNNILTSVNLPEIDANTNQEYIANTIKERIQKNSYYGFDTEFSKSLSGDESKPAQYCERLVTEGKEKYEGKTMMICNQSALLSTLLLKKYGIPARMVSGMAGSKNIFGPGHAWTEYRDQTTNSRKKLDATPYQTPPDHLAQEMYEKATEIENQRRARMHKERFDMDTQINNDYTALPAGILNRVEYSSPNLDFANTTITTQQLEIVLKYLYRHDLCDQVEMLGLGRRVDSLPWFTKFLSNIKTLNIQYNEQLSWNDLISAIPNGVFNPSFKIKAPLSWYADGNPQKIPPFIQNMLIPWEADDKGVEIETPQSSPTQDE